MALSSVPLTVVSLRSNVTENPQIERAVVFLDEDRDYQLIWTLEWYWGLPKGALSTKCRLNRFEMRADMLKSYNEDGWILMPTTETLKAIEVMLRHNIQAGNTQRRTFTEEFPAAMHQYQLLPAALSGKGRRPTIYVDIGEATPRQFHYPYSDLPTVESRTHPFFVLHALEGFMLGSARVLRYPWLRPYRQAALRVSGLWRGAPPREFRWGPDLPLEHWHPKSIKADNASDERYWDTSDTQIGYGPDAWAEHRHPSSDDGSTARAQLATCNSSCEKRTQRVARGPARPASPQSEAHQQNPSIYDRARQGTKLPKSPALPRSTRASEAGSSDSNPNVNFSPTNLREWLDSITPTLSDKTEVRSPRPSSSTGDDALTRYREEPARDPANALRGTLLVTHAEFVDASDGLQRSVYCSNDWAWHVYHKCLWSSSPPQKARFGHVDLRVA
ncbi:hypothetical protein EV715DRAFT_296434 [Schizophyllum commune]